MYRRPLSVDIAGALLYISGIFLLLASVLYCVGLFFDPEREYYKNFVLDAVQGIFMLGASVLSLVVIMFIVKGANWARFLYFGLVVVTFVLKLALAIVNNSNWLALLLTALAQGCIIVLLFLPKANLYFASPARPHRRAAGQQS
jgi:hypothetical protein